MSNGLRLFIAFFLVGIVIATVFTTIVCSVAARDELVPAGLLAWLCVLWFLLGAIGSITIVEVAEERRHEILQIQEAFRQQHIDDLAAKYTEEEAA